MRTLYIFALVMISSFAKSQNFTCADFRIGTFKIESTNYKVPISTVNRFEKTQKELADGIEPLEATIEWKSECNYELVYLNGPSAVKGKKVSVTILRVEGQKAICTSVFEGMPEIILNFEMEKIK